VLATVGLRQLLASVCSDSEMPWHSVSTSPLIFPSASTSSCNPCPVDNSHVEWHECYFRHRRENKNSNRKHTAFLRIAMVKTGKSINILLWARTEWKRTLKQQLKKLSFRREIVPQAILLANAILWNNYYRFITTAACRCGQICYKHSCSARAKRTLFLTKSARTLTHFIMRTHFTFF